MKKTSVVIVLGLLLIGGCWKKNIYRPCYYPNKNDLTQYIKGPDFSSLDEARDWVYEQNELRHDENWDYEIGKNPKPSKYGDIEICEETLQ